MATENVYKLNINNKEIILIGTAHISRKSVDEVKELIEQEKPDTVCVELCQSRYTSIIDVDRWKNTDIMKVIKEGKSLMLLVSLILSSYQKKMAKQFGIQAGQEMLQGISSAEELGAELCLADRDIQTTMLRLWRAISLWGKIKLFFQLILSMLTDETITEEELEKMKSKDMLSAALDELSVSFPQFKAIIIDERDKYLAQKIKTASGDKIVAVVGAGHLQGIISEIKNEHNLDKLAIIPKPPNTMKVLAWSIPVFILLVIALTFSIDQTAGMDQVVSWILWNGSLGALGTLIAFGHPLSILTAFLVAPISSLSPLLAAGWFAGLTEAILRKPSVQDFEDLSEDIHTFKGFWHNRVTHILLVVAFANLGSTMGTMIGGAEVIRQFINTVFS